MDIRVEIDSEGARRALAAFPGVMTGNVDRYLSRAAMEVAREAKLAAPKSFSTLENSIRSEKDGLLAYVVAPGVNYAAGVEYGTGPAAGEAAYFPNPGALEPYVKRSGGSAWALARYIFAHGTKPHPYMAPTAQKMRPSVEAMVNEGVDAGIREAFGS
jgi:hypothetical protein